jgi:hypothetical protein
MCSTMSKEKRRSRGRRREQRDFRRQASPYHVCNCAESVSDATQSHEGLQVRNLAAELGVSVSDAQKGADELVAYSLTFTTVDDSTFAILEY